MRRSVAALLAVAACLAVAAPAQAGGPSMRVGAAEDAAKWGDPVAKMQLAKLAGFDAVRMTLQWSSGMTAPDAGELANTRAAADAARLTGIEPIVTLYNRGSSVTPAEPASRAQFAQFATAAAAGLPAVSRFIVGNEPNSNLFWQPQFNPDGTSAAPAAYLALLAASYDAIKQARPDASVVGGALAPRGSDNPAASKQTHSPTRFIRELGAAYRASGRTSPVMDVFDLHPYADNSSLPPSMEHPASTTISLADYGKLVALLGEAFDGTGQPGSTLPILYGEFGVESLVPAAKASLYSGAEPATTKPVDEAQQAAYYREAFKLAHCQPTVVGILVFHVTDESALDRWQSGPYYADDTAKSSLPAIRDAASASRAGTLTGCPDRTPPSATVVSPAPGTVVGPAGIAISASASDDVGVGKVQLLVGGTVVATKYAPPYTFSWSPSASGEMQITVAAHDALRNVGSSAPVLLVADVTAPETTLASTPPDPQERDTEARFELTGSEAGVAFACSLDGAPFAPCGSLVTFPGLGMGEHVFQARATDQAGNVDQTPAAHTWTVVDTTPPETTITSAPAATTTLRDGTFAFSASEAASFECALDGAPFTACTAPVLHFGLAYGAHSFQVRATDEAGNVDPTPAAWSWTIVVGPPNDAFVAAVALAGSSGRVTGTTQHGSAEPGEPAHAGSPAARSVWYQWTATCTCWFTFETAGSAFDSVLALYRGSSFATLRVAGANDDAGFGSRTSRVRFKATAGTTYRVAVDAKGGTSGALTLAWRRS